MNALMPMLDRPQYVPSPEVLLSALAWSVVPRQQKSIGLIYERHGTRGARKVQIEQTMPSAAQMNVFAQSLNRAGYRTVGSRNGLPKIVAESVTAAIRGSMPQEGKGTPSAALGLCGALLQDPVGALSVEGPPNFAKLINTMYALGHGSPEFTAGIKWHTAARRQAQTKQLKPIETAFASTTLKPYLPAGWDGNADPDPRAKPTELPLWWQRDVLDAGVPTPFSWFQQSWDRLCSDYWVTTLPPRRWAAWAVCVLRHALGFGFLWEANFFREVARGLIDGSLSPEAAATWSLRPTRPLIAHNSGSTAQMDVKPAMWQLLASGLACREAVLQACKFVDRPATSLPDLMSSLKTRVDKPQRASLQAALRGEAPAMERSLKNLREAVRYALLARGTASTPDHTSLLRVVSRNYTHVAAGPEWIVVMAALSAGPGAKVLRLGDVRVALDALGFRPRIDFLLGELERAGLCASAPDGDEGIEVKLGFVEAQS